MAQPRATRPPLWRDKKAMIEYSRKSKRRCDKGESMVWLRSKKGDEIHAPFHYLEQFQKTNARNITKTMNMNWNVMVSSRNRKHMSQSTMIKAKNTIMKERTWINRVAQRDVTNVKRSGESSNMESRNLVPCVDLCKEFKTARANKCPRRACRCSSRGTQFAREFYQRDVPDEMRTPWKLPREACYDHLLFEGRPVRILGGTSTEECLVQVKGE